MATKYLQIVLTEPVPGSDDEYNEWYDTIHLPEVLRMPGFVRGQRFRLVDSRPATDGSRYLAVYEVESDNIDETLQIVVDGAPERTKSPAINNAKSVIRMYEAIGDPLHRVESSADAPEHP